MGHSNDAPRPELFGLIVLYLVNNRDVRRPHRCWRQEHSKAGCCAIKSSSVRNFRRETLRFGRERCACRWRFGNAPLHAMITWHEQCCLLYRTVPWCASLCACALPQPVCLFAHQSLLKIRRYETRKNRQAVEGWRASTTDVTFS